MVELSCRHRETVFATANDWTAPLDNRPITFLQNFRQIMRKRHKDVRTEQYLAPSNAENSSDASSKFQSRFTSVIFGIISNGPENSHSRTSHLLTGLNESDSRDYNEADFQRHQDRCHSCEPEGQQPMSMPQCNNLNCQRCPLSPTRTRLSLSDSEICYREEREQQSPLKDIMSTDDDPSQIETPLDEVSPACAIIPTGQSPSVFVLESDESLQGDDGDCSPDLSPSKDSEKASFESSVLTVQTPTKKKVRFNDEIGKELFMEKLISNTYIPPKLHLDTIFAMDNDLGDLGDSLPGITRAKHNSMPDMMRLPPTLPRVQASLGSSDSLYEIRNRLSNCPSSPRSGICRWRLSFTQPAAQYLAFRRRLESNCVSLENVSISNQPEDDNRLCLHGTIKVKNIALVKNVKLRATSDSWATYNDYSAVHSVNYSNGAVNSSYDTFMFNLNINFSEMVEPRELQFAVCFQAGENVSGGEYWDNNDGCNYVVKEDPPLMTTDIDRFFRDRPSMGTREVSTRTAVGGTNASYLASASPPISSYTSDYRPNFEGFNSLTSYSSWQHYSSESMYY